MKVKVPHPAVAEHEARHAFSALARAERHSQPVNQAPESLGLFGAEFIQPFYVALRLCDEMTEIPAVASTEDMARVDRVVFVEDATLH